MKITPPTMRKKNAPLARTFAQNNNRTPESLGYAAIAVEVQTGPRRENGPMRALAPVNQPPRRMRR